MSTKAQRTQNGVGSFRRYWAALWLVALILAMFILSYLCPFDGIGLIPSPWDSVIMGAAALAVYFAGTRSGFWYTSRGDWKKNGRPALAEGSEEVLVAIAPANFRSPRLSVHPPGARGTS